jgi:hypothetical protein
VAATRANTSPSCPEKVYVTPFGFGVTVPSAASVESMTATGCIPNQTYSRVGRGYCASSEATPASTSSRLDSSTRKSSFSRRDWKPGCSWDIGPRSRCLHSSRAIHGALPAGTQKPCCPPPVHRSWHFQPVSQSSRVVHEWVHTPPVARRKHRLDAQSLATLKPLVEGAQSAGTPSVTASTSPPRRIPPSSSQPASKRLGLSRHAPSSPPSPTLPPPPPPPPLPPVPPPADWPPPPSPPSPLPGGGGGQASTPSAPANTTQRTRMR